jgi:integrase
MTDTQTIPAALLEQLALLADPIAAARAQLAKPVPIQEWAETYRIHMERKTESQDTVRSYRSTLHLFVEHVLAHGSVVTKPVIESFLASRAEFSRGANPANTWNRHLSCLRSMFTYLVANQLETGCPTIYREQALAVERMTKPVSTAHPIDHRDWMMIWNSPLTIDERFWLGFSYYAGLRRFEVASLTVGSIDITGSPKDRGLHHIRRKGKGDRRFGDVPYGLMASLVAKTFPRTVGRHVGMWFECVEHVVSMRGPDPDALVCVRADDRDPTNADRFKWVNDDWNGLLRLYGVTTHYKLHDLRDSCSTNLTNVPGLRPDDRMRWMAHVDKSTNDLYTKYDDDHALALLA